MSDNIIGWFTAHGQRTPIKYGQSKEDAINARFDKKSKDIENAKKQSEVAKSQAINDAKPLHKSTPNDFSKTIARAKQLCDERDSWRVDAHSPDKYKDSKLFSSKDGSTVAVENTGNIVSVCRVPNDTTVSGRDLLAYAVRNGGTKLDSFAGNHRFYAKCGFEPISWTPFNKQFAPPGWKEGRDAEEPIIFYAYTGKTSSISLNDFLSKTPPFTGDDGYDKARDYRDSKVRK